MRIKCQNSKQSLSQSHIFFAADQYRRRLKEEVGLWDNLSMRDRFVEVCRGSRQFVVLMSPALNLYPCYHKRNG